PPKITISETSTHHTARRPVGMFMLARCVAIVLTLIGSALFVLGPVVALPAGGGVLVGPAIDRGHLAPVAVRRGRVRRPLERVRLPRVLLGLGAAHHAVDEVDD